MIRVVTDSTADLPPHVARELEIEIVPIHVIWGGKSYRDGVDITPDEFFSRLAGGESPPTTSQPPKDDFERVYSRLAGDAEGIVSLHISSKLSGTYGEALKAASSTDYGVPVSVMDTRLITMGLGLAAVAAARLARQGAGLSAVLEEAQRAVSQIRMLGMFDTLKYAIAGGRVSRSVGKVASVLSIKPMMTVRGGAVVPAGIARTYSKGIEILHDFVRKNLPVRDLAIVHSAAAGAAEKLAGSLAGLLPARDVFVSQMGASLGSHGGAGMLLVAMRAGSRGP